MASRVVVGCQWGDEGKGKIIDFLAEEADVVVRYQGGNNAGHTVKVGDQLYVLHLVPSGILYPGKKCVIGNGVVVDPPALLKEMDELAGRGIGLDGRLLVSDRAHVVFPHHRLLDEAREAALNPGRRIGTTKRGIGPAYADKAARQGLRMAELVDEAFPELAAPCLELANGVLEGMGATRFDAGAVIESYAAAADRLRPFVTDTLEFLRRAADEGLSLLFEGAQGTMLDLDFGTYPFVTSSSATAGGACTGTGIAPRRIDEVIGVVKAYATRVGEGPFPTELKDEAGLVLGREGNEFGATTGRPRRCGWFDAVAAGYAARLNGVDRLAVTKLDVLDSFARLKIAVAYECGGKRFGTVPASVRLLAGCRPVYEEMPGWKKPTTDARRLADLPGAARAYLERLSGLTGAPIGVLSVGPRRESTFITE